MKIYGLIGKNLSHSFSESYFKKKFIKKNINNVKYINFEINNINDLDRIINNYNPSGLNVTIPFKEKILSKLDCLTEEAKEIGAVNTIQFKNNKLIGHNTDVLGFKNSIYPFLQKGDTALIIGDGGSSKAIKFILEKLNINYQVVNRNSDFDYNDITNKDIINNRIIINTTPLGMYPDINDFPKIPYNSITKNHFLFDLIYNPEETLFLKFGKNKLAKTKNGLEMLNIQADESWKIWNL